MERPEQGFHPVILTLSCFHPIAQQAGIIQQNSLIRIKGRDMRAGARRAFFHTEKKTILCACVHIISFHPIYTHNTPTLLHKNNRMKTGYKQDNRMEVFA